MEWTEIIMALLGGTTLAGVAEAVRFRKENRRMREAEAKNAENDEQRQRIDLADLYTSKVLELTEQTYKATVKGNDNQDRMMESLARLDTRLEKVEVKVDDIVGYLNGDFQRYLAEHPHGKGGGDEA